MILDENANKAKFEGLSYLPKQRATLVVNWRGRLHSEPVVHFYKANNQEGWQVTLRSGLVPAAQEPLRTKTTEGYRCRLGISTLRTLDEAVGQADVELEVSEAMDRNIRQVELLELALQ